MSLGSDVTEMIIFNLQSGAKCSISVQLKLFKTVFPALFFAESVTREN